MRITNSMLSDASLQAGMPLAGNTLASYLNGDASDSIISSLGEKHNSVTNWLSKEKYEKLKDAAETLEQSSGRLNQAGSRSVYEKAKASGDTSEVCEEVEKLASAYNEMLDKLKTDTSTLGRFYQQSLKEAVTENKEVLSRIGITTDKNGRLNVDKEKLGSADLDSIESVFGAAGTLSSKLNLIAGKVADSAQANIKSASSQYDAAGNSVDTLLRNYDAKR